MPAIPIPIPERCASRPLHQGLVVPYVSLTIDGTAHLGQTHGLHVAEAIAYQLCQICGQKLDDKAVFLLTATQLEDRFTAEPGMHPECAAYAQRACPMVSGRMPTYSRKVRDHTGTACNEPGCDCGGWVTENPGEHAGAPAEPWFAVWVDGYAIGIKDADAPLTVGNVTGCVLNTEFLKVRPVRRGAPGGAR